MEKLISIVMYVLWILTIIAILSATFTNFKYEDLNVMAGVLLGISVLNSFLMVSRKSKK